ncbi:MAG: glutamate-1-semialdehyde 2,1-aminomutase [Firmicutes bacterium]|nr:glutamate-1-semialdehyde 2,1-aminomutase [Bacillota bacterium]
MALERKRSAELYQEALRLMPGGVNSPVRAFKAVGGHPVFFERGLGARLFDVDGNEYVDYVCSWGALIAGHAHPHVIRSIQERAAAGTSFGAPVPGELRLAGLILEAFPRMGLVRLVSSGTEATMTAVRLARGFTGRERIVKFDGCYHGHSDSLLVEAGSGAATLGLPGSAGVPVEIAARTISIPFNEPAAVREAFRRFGPEIACLIVEPVAANMGLVSPIPGFLEEAVAAARAAGALIIFDEVITGFRLAFGGVQAILGLEPDLTCLGKIIGGGMPVGAVGGRREIMEWLAPRGPVYQAGTLSGNPVAVAAGAAALEILQRERPYPGLEEKGEALAAGLAREARQAGVPVHINRAGSMLTVFFTPVEVRDYRTARAADPERYARFFHGMLSQGIYLPPSQFESWFLSTTHGWTDVENTIRAAHRAFREL